MRRSARSPRTPRATSRPNVAIVCIELFAASSSALPAAGAACYAVCFRTRVSSGSHRPDQPHQAAASPPESKYFSFGDIGNIPRCRFHWWSGRQRVAPSTSSAAGPLGEYARVVRKIARLLRGGPSLCGPPHHHRQPPPPPPPPTGGFPRGGASPRFPPAVTLAVGKTAGSPAGHHPPRPSPHRLPAALRRGAAGRPWKPPKATLKAGRKIINRQLKNNGGAPEGFEKEAHAQAGRNSPRNRRPGSTASRLGHPGSCEGPRRSAGSSPERIEGE